MIIDLTGVVLPDSEAIEVLRSNSIPVEVEQRKSFDEYYIKKNEIEASPSLEELQAISNNFCVEITPMRVLISES